MAQTYEQLGQLMNDPVFRSRIKVACLHFAAYILGEATTVPAHNTRIKWAQSCVQNPDVAAQQVAPVVCMDAKVVEQGADISDPDLQTAVETAINGML